jgi:hypothetical protein
MSLVIPAGSITVMRMNTPPPGWTKTNTANLNALRVVNGAVSSGGTVNYTSAFTTLSSTVTTSTITSGQTSMSLNMIPPHVHVYQIGSATISQSTVVPPNSSGLLVPSASGQISGGSPTEGTTGHSHPVAAPVSSISGTLDMAIRYVDAILVQRS